MDSENQQQRYHGLDALRAVMLLLGVLLHASLSYFPHQAGLRDAGRWWFHDAASSWAAAGLFVGIHTYRMPVFFVLAGFFTALLISKRSISAMAKNRLSRIAIPLALSAPILIPATWIAASAAYAMQGHSKTPLLTSLPDLLTGGASLQYLWFLWHLLILCGATACLTTLLARTNNRTRAILDDASANLFSHWTGWLVILAVTVCLNIKMQPLPGFLQTEPGLAPAWHVLAYHGLFFFTGIVLYRHRGTMLNRLARRATVLLACGLSAVTLFAGGLGLAVLSGEPNAYAIPLAVSASVAVWLAVAGCVGISIKLGDRPSATMRYLADSSYWVYLTHMPVLFLFQAALVPAQLSGDAKLLLSTGLTMASCLVTYELWVRYGWLSQLLNGRRHVRSETPTQSVPMPAPIQTPEIASRRAA